MNAPDLPAAGSPPPPPNSPLPLADAHHFDEMHARPARQAADEAAAPALTPAWREFFRHFDLGDPQELDRRAARVARQLRNNGVTYNVYADETNLQRPWPLDLFPLLITASDWALIEAGVLQRVQVLETVMRDIYGPRQLLKDGLLPAALVQGHPDYLRAMHGVPPVGGQHLHVVAFDLARGPQGHWWVVSQRTQAPSGLGYLLENRSAVSTQFPDAFEAMNVRRLADTYRGFIKGLKAMAPGGADAHIALLTPGPHNETYFEHSYLARYLGVTLVEGSDLTVRNQRLYLKTLHGLRPVHGLIKRVDDAFLDPLEMRRESHLGVPGLLQAVRAGHVMVANAPGAGFLESSALLGFLPALGRALLGESLRLPALHTWWCGEPAALAEVLPQLGQCVVKPTYPWSASRGTFHAGIGPLMSEQVQASWADSIRRAPEEHTVQAYLPPSQMPTWRGGAQGQIVPRAAILRVFALTDGAGGWRVLPGGMTRLVNESAGLATMALGGSSADTGVLDERPAREPPEFDHSALATITPSDTALVQRERLLTSRSAENLFWLGRYTERAENSARLARITLSALHGEEAPSLALLMWLGQLTEAAGLVPAQAPSPQDDRAEFERLLIHGLGDAEHTPGVGHALRKLRQAAAALRERLSPEHWSFIKLAEERFLRECTPLRGSATDAEAETLHSLAQLSHTLAAITGAQQDRMWRDDGWRLMAIGRQIERLTWLSEALSRGFYTNAVHDAAGHGVVLDLFDSTISYHARYQRSRSMAALIEHVVLNHQNPRSLGWVVQSLRSRLARLHANDPHTLEDLSQRLRNPQPEDLTLLCESDTTGDFIHLQALLSHFMTAGHQLSHDIGLRHFIHTADVGRSVGA
jgi:uncharacterized circularly permuted ATP-grasp superfamily protein/uncharacterized alpha-E superfamily protein